MIHQNGWGNRSIGKLSDLPQFELPNTRLRPISILLCKHQKLYMLRPVLLFCTNVYHCYEKLIMLIITNRKVMIMASHSAFSQQYLRQVQNFNSLESQFLVTLRYLIIIVQQYPKPSRNHGLYRQQLQQYYTVQRVERRRLPTDVTLSPIYELMLPYSLNVHSVWAVLWDLISRSAVDLCDLVKIIGKRLRLGKPLVHYPLQVIAALILLEQDVSVGNVRTSKLQ